MPLCVFRRKTWLFLVTASLCGVVIESKAAPDSEVRRRGDAAATAADTMPSPEDRVPRTRQEYVDFIVQDANTAGTLANFVMYGADRHLASAQSKFTRGDVAGGLAELRFVSDTVDANQTHLADLGDAVGLSRYVDDVANTSMNLSRKVFLDVPINVDGVDYSARELLYSPDGMKAVRKHHLESDLRLDPKFVADYLDDNTDATKREAMGIIVDNITQPIQVTTPSGVKTISPESSSEQARDYATAFMDLWDTRTNADGTTMPGFATVFGKGTAEFITSLLESKQDKAFSPRVLRAVTAIYRNDIRSGESGYARARRAASGLIRLKRLFMQLVMEKGPRVRSIYDCEELFATLLSKLADQACRSGDKLDLGSLHAKVAFRELFEEAVKKGIAEKPKTISTWEKDNAKKP